MTAPFHSCFLDSNQLKRIQQVILTFLKKKFLFGFDIAVVREAKMKGSGIENKDDYILFYSGVEERRAKTGIAIEVGRKWTRK